ncbi:MAG TPA: hypothetical protein PK691_05415, partial [Thermomicrobiales bacterium]|nr:hypothetical protein [Thermomicrobiales bacterium]
MIWLEILTSSLGLGLAAFTAWSAVRGTDWGVLIVIGTVPIQRAFMIGHGSAEITFTQACLIAFLAAAMLRFASGRLCIRLDLPTLLVLAMPLFMLMSVVANPGLRGWAGESYRWIGPALFFSIARSYVDFSTIRRLAMVLSSMAIGTTIWAVVQIVNERGPSSFQRNGLMRVYGGFGE